MLPPRRRHTALGPRAAHSSPHRTIRASRVTPTQPVSAPTWRTEECADAVSGSLPRVLYSASEPGPPPVTGWAAHSESASLHRDCRAGSRALMTSGGHCSRPARCTTPIATADDRGRPGEHGPPRSAGRSPRHQGDRREQRHGHDEGRLRGVGGDDGDGPRGGEPQDHPAGAVRPEHRQAGESDDLNGQRGVRVRVGGRALGGAVGPDDAEEEDRGRDDQPGHDDFGAHARGDEPAQHDAHDEHHGREDVRRGE